jgi:serine protease Do
MNTAIRRSANNIGFAIPVNMIKELLPRLLADGTIKRSAIGVVVAPFMPEDRERLKLPEASGVLVSVVVPGGPADKAGLVVDDVILSFQGEALPSPDRLRWVASLAGVGKTVTLRVARGGRMFDLQVKLDALPERAAPSTPLESEEDFP